MNSQCFINTFGSYPQQFANNVSYYPSCDTSTFQNTPPPGFNGMNVPPVNVAASTVPPYKPELMQFSRPPPGYPPGPMGVSFPYPPFNSHPPYQHPTAPFPNTSSFPPAFQNYSTFTPANNQFQQPVYSPATAQPVPVNPAFGYKYPSVGTHSFRRKDWKVKEEKVSCSELVGSVKPTQCFLLVIGDNEFPCCRLCLFTVNHVIAISLRKISTTIT